MVGRGYTLPFAVLLITGGRLGDILGRKRTFVVGMVLFVLCSALCAIAPNVSMLLAARGLQGASAALIIPQTFGLIRAMFEGVELAKALGMIGPVMALAAVCGPVLGGVLTDTNILGVGWRSVFGVNVPLGVAVLLVSPLIREDRSPHNPRLDLVGTVLVAIAAGLLIYPLVQGNDAGWPAWTWVCMALGVVVLAAFIRHQIEKVRRAGSPLVEPGLFCDRMFPAAMLSSLLFFAVMNGLMFVLVVFLQIGPDMSALGAGLTMLPWSVGLAVGSWFAGAVLVPRFGARVMRAGVAMTVLGLGSTAMLIAAPAPELTWRLPLPLLVAGTGLGMFTVPFFANALSRVAHHETGSASGLLNAVQQLGATVGVALLGTAFFHLTRNCTAQLASCAATGTQLALWISSAMLVAVLVLTYPMLPKPRTPCKHLLG